MKIFRYQTQTSKNLFCSLSFLLSFLQIWFLPSSGLHILPAWKEIHFQRFDFSNYDRAMTQFIQLGLKYFYKICSHELDKYRWTLNSASWLKVVQENMQGSKTQTSQGKSDVLSHDGFPCLLPLLICLCWSLFKLCSWLVFLSYGKTWPLSRSS